MPQEDMPQASINHRQERATGSPKSKLTVSGSSLEHANKHERSRRHSYSERYGKHVWHSTALHTSKTVQHVTDADTSLLRNTIMVVVVSPWILTSGSVSECLVLERLSRALRDQPPQRDRSMPAPHAHRFYRLMNEPQSKNSLRDRNDRGKEPSPTPDRLYDVTAAAVGTLCFKLAPKRLCCRNT